MTEHLKGMETRTGHSYQVKMTANKQSNSYILLFLSEPSMSSQPVHALGTKLCIFLVLIQHISQLDRLTYFPSTFCSANNFLCIYWPELFAIQLTPQ